jgi:hypothetical protein
MVGSADQCLAVSDLAHNEVHVKQKDFWNGSRNLMRTLFTNKRAASFPVFPSQIFADVTVAFACQADVMARRRDNAAPLPQHVSVRVCPPNPPQKTRRNTRELLTSWKTLVRFLLGALFAKSNGHGSWNQFQDPLIAVRSHWRQAWTSAFSASAFANAFSSNRSSRATVRFASGFNSSKAMKAATISQAIMT